MAQAQTFPVPSKSELRIKLRIKYKQWINLKQKLHTSHQKCGKITWVLYSFVGSSIYSHILYGLGLRVEIIRHITQLFLLTCSLSVNECVADKRVMDFIAIVFNKLFLLFVEVISICGGMYLCISIPAITELNSVSPLPIWCSPDRKFKTTWKLAKNHILHGWILTRLSGLKILIGTLNGCLHFLKERHCNSVSRKWQ